MNKVLVVLALLVLGFPVTALSSEEDAIQKVVQKMDSALNSGDFDTYMSFFAENAVEMPPGEAALIGVEAIRGRDGNFFENYTDNISTKVEDVQVAKNFAIVRVSYQESWTPKAGGATRTAVGKGIFVLEKQSENTWKITSLIWNHDKPIE